MKRKFSKKRLYKLLKLIVVYLSVVFFIMGGVFFLAGIPEAGYTMTGYGVILLIIFFGGTKLYKYLFPVIKKKK